MPPTSGIRQLSPEILERILQYAAGSPAHDLAEWRDRLSLLAVCREWRTLAAPHAFSQLYIELAGSRADGAQAASNAELIARAGRQGSVTAVDIRSDDPHSILDFAEDAARLLGEHASVWRAARALRASFEVDEQLAAATRGGASAAMEARAADITARLRGLLPGVDRMEILGSARSTETAVLMARLVDLYALDLRHLDCALPLPLAAPRFSDALAHLAMVFDGEAAEARLPRVHARSLRYLSLGNVLGNGDDDGLWLSFRQDSGVRAIEFSSLKRLCIKFASAAAHGDDDDGDDGDDGNTQEDNDNDNGADSVPTDALAGEVLSRLRFPALQTLSLGMGRAARRMLALAHFPDSLQTLRLTGPMVGGAMSLRRAQFDSAARSAICRHIIARGSGDALCAPDFFLGSDAISSDVALHVAGTAKIPSGAVQWPSLTELSIDSKVAASTLLSLLPRMPSLAALHASDIVVDVAMYSLGLHFDRTSTLNDRIAELARLLLLGRGALLSADGVDHVAATR